MKRKYGVRPGKAQSAAGLIVGILFVMIGITAIIPSGAGAFGVIWTLTSVFITLMNAINLFSENGIVTHTVITEEDAPKNTAKSSADRLTELKRLYDGGLITKDEYEQKRREILNDI